MGVTFIDVEETPERGKEHGIEQIPTQVFFSPKGRELFRHVGFMAKEDILAKWRELGYDFAE
jgi:thioredoxin 1